ncbi:hypothetical protein F5879DRAFT_802350 [Lentinula edodes]|uniref:Mediator of RNA polymerase II transcription subunit 21 n=1 Tax=Lentinula edodes TaxID=5353 RepID=A0A1Q3E0G6_LENED|nr:hypothetical protein F5879DRAFT_802350 [Lentinula edodes]KAJ3915412.1 hypothetical protein F5877DRAFT_81848 [Lentinula edodes]GAW00743.1 hypothetical protein LENED_002290 [Lentinula edodes]
MLQELSHMDRITQLQDEIQQLLMIMSTSIAYLTNRTNFIQVSPEIPITKQRNPDKYDTPDVFEANKKELVTDLIRKAKQVEYLINSLPEPEPEEIQAQRLQQLEDEMQLANTEYIQAVNRLKALHEQVTELLRSMLTEVNAGLVDDTNDSIDAGKEGNIMVNSRDWDVSMAL